MLNNESLDPGFNVSSGTSAPGRCSYYGVTTVCPGNASTPDDAFYDYNVVSRALTLLEHAHSLTRNASSGTRHANFWLGVGLRRPHLDWRVPRRFWELYGGDRGRDGEAIRLAATQSMRGSNTSLLAYERNGPMSANYSTDGEHFFSEGPVQHYYDLGLISKLLPRLE